VWALLLMVALGSAGAALATWRRCRDRVRAGPTGEADTAQPRSKHGFDEPEARAPLDPAPHGASRPTDAAVDLTVVLGRRAPRPLILKLPVLVEPPPATRGRSRRLGIALAQAATAVGTAVFSSAGPFVPEERADAARWILRWGRSGFRHGLILLTLADMIEIPLGPAGIVGPPAGGPGHRPRTVRRTVPRSGSGHHSDRVEGRSVAAWIRAARRVQPDVPVALRLPVATALEAQLAAAVALGVDVVTLDATRWDVETPPVAEAVGRASRWMERHGLADTVQLVVAAPVRGAEDIADLLVLGADAVVVGAALHRALDPDALHRTGPAVSSPRRRGGVDLDAAAVAATRWLQSVGEELAGILRASGAASIRDLDRRRRWAGGAGPLRQDPFPELPALVATYRVATAVLHDLAELVPRLYGMTGSHPRPRR
jgi:hypothetical protein